MSAKDRSETKDSRNPPRPKDSPSPAGKGRKAKSGDLGRALRTIYDDTLRESVPDDFMDLIGKLS